MDGMELLTAFDTAFTEFDRLVHETGGDQWDDPTPCTEWTVRDLVNHLVAEHLWAPRLLDGETVAEVGDRYDGDVVGDDPVAAWERAGAGSRPAFHRGGALDGRVDTSGGPTPADEYAWQMTMDLTVHGWDLARGLGTESRMPDDLARALYDAFAPQVAAWQGAGVFEPPVELPEGAAPQDRLVALLGRDPRATPR
jgi:uncharacterized protein (TIGR03086 family)